MKTLSLALLVSIVVFPAAPVASQGVTLCPDGRSPRDQCLNHQNLELDYSYTALNQCLDFDDMNEDGRDFVCYANNDASIAFATARVAECIRANQCDWLW